MSETELAKLSLRRPADYARQWLENLLSNPDCQGTNYLFSYDFDKNGSHIRSASCCGLGAAWAMDDDLYSKLGLTSDECDFIATEVIEMNDYEGKSFEEIAEYLLGYFVKKGILPGKTGP